MIILWLLLQENRANGDWSCSFWGKENMFLFIMQKMQLSLEVLVALSIVTMMNFTFSSGSLLKVIFLLSTVSTSSKKWLRVRVRRGRLNGTISCSGTFRRMWILIVSLIIDINTDQQSFYIDYITHPWVLLRMVNWLFLHSRCTDLFFHPLCRFSESRISQQRAL